MKTKLFAQKLMTLLAFMCLISSMVMAVEQQQKITGTVKDAQGNPMPGVTVQIKGTTMGAITDVDGNYTIYAGPSNTLVFTFVGMQKQEVKIKNQRIINVTMQSNNKSRAIVDSRLIYIPNCPEAILEDQLIKNNSLC